MIVIGMAVLASSVVAVRSPRRNEAFGALICFIGAAITLLDTGSQQGDQTVTVLGACWPLAVPCSSWATSWSGVSCVHGSRFSSMPSVTLIAALLLLPLSYALEPNFAEFGVVGWTDAEFFVCLLLALVAGLRVTPG